MTGRIFDVAGNYTLAFIFHIVSFTMAAAAFYSVRKPATTAAAPEAPE